MEPMISTLEIQGFRALRELRIEGLGLVNLITGRNNSGKSSVLEALRILASGASPRVIDDILHFREEDNSGLNDMVHSTRDIYALDSFQWSSLFHGFPHFSNKLSPISINASGQRSMNVELSAGWFVIERNPDGTRKYVPQQEDLFGDFGGVPALTVEGTVSRRIIPLDYPSRSNVSRVGRGIYSENLGESRLPCVAVSPYGGEYTATLGPMWDSIALSDQEEEVVRALQIIDPNIQAVSMVGGEKSQRQRTAIVRSKGISRPVPLRSFGDGLNRLFGIILSLVNAKGGVLLIDEIENGMHYSIQPDIWRAIFKMAHQLEVQVVATSHSWDTIEAFQHAATKDPADGVLIRLTRMGDNVVPTIFTEDELTIATREHIEVR